MEVKFRYKDGIEKKLEGVAELVVEKFEHDLYFNHPCRDFGETDEALRIRKDLEGVSLTYKGPKVDFETKSREEIKIKVNNFEEAVKLLEKLGFIPVREVKKLRKIYRLGDAIVCVDDVEGVGKFVEIEVESDNIEKKEKLFEIAKFLGYSRSESITESYLEMVLKNSQQKLR